MTPDHRNLAAKLACAALVAGCSGALKNTDPASGRSQPRNATLTRVIDGDTVEVTLPSGKLRGVRLVGIDTPETVRPGAPVECGGPAATRSAERFEGQRVRLVVDPTQDKVDRYGRLLRYVVTGAGVDVGRKQIALGHAAVYVYDDEFARLPSYERASGIARDRGRGVWGGCGGDFHQPK